jgi:type III secretion apparatus needle protein
MTTSNRSLQGAEGTPSTDTAGYDPSKSFLDRNTQLFEAASERYLDNLNKSITAMGAGDTTNPKILADYQKASAMWTMQLSAQSSFVKNVKDSGMTVIHNFN